MRCIRVSRPLMPLDTGVVHLQNSSADAGARAGGHAARLAAIAVHEQTVEFCGVGTSVTLTGRARGSAGELAEVHPEVGPVVYENVSARGHAAVLAEDLPAVFEYTSDGKRWKIVDMHASSDDDTGDILCECERVRDDPLKREGDEAAAASAEDELSRIVENLESLKRPVNCNVWKYMPADEASDGGYLSSHHEVATWTGASKQLLKRRMRRTRALSVRDEHRNDPYMKVANSVDSSQSWRRELFSFACADLCELSDIERIALLSQFATVGRLEFVGNKLGEVLSRAAAEEAIRG